MTDVLQPQGVDAKQFYDRPEGPGLVEELSPAEVDRWWMVYDADFAELNRTNPSRQSFNEEEFRAVINDPNMAKFAYIEGGEIVSLCLLSSDMNHFPWLSQEFYKEKYPEQFERDKIHYFVSLLTREDKRGQDYASGLIDFMTELYQYEDDPPVITFDCCALNSTFLPEMIEGVVAGAGAELKFEELGTQHYYAGQLVVRAAADEPS